MCVSSVRILILNYACTLLTVFQIDDQNMEEIKILSIMTQQIQNGDVFLGICMNKKLEYLFNKQELRATCSVVRELATFDYYTT